MNDMRNQAREQALQYLRQQIENASPAQQIVLLYDGAVKFTLQAREAIVRGDIEGRYNANRRAVEIVGYLLEILDVEKGGEVGARLERIYTFLLKKLLEVDFRNEVSVCDEVLEHLRILRAGWQQLAAQGTGSAAPAAAAPAPAAGGVPNPYGAVVSGPGGETGVSPVVRRSAVA